jgi:hypothetical protein
MASTYVNDLRLNEMATGDASGSWGTVTNTNLELIGEAFSYGTETIGDADSTLTIADGAADAARSFYLKITSSVDLTTTRIVTLGPNTVSKVWMIENATTGSQVITIKQGSGATINVPNGQVKMISTDGAGSGGAVLDLLVDVDLTGTTTLVNLDVSGAVDIAGDLTLSAGGDGALRFTAASSVKVLDNNAAALVFEEADNAYMTFVTTDGSEAVKFDKALDINAATQIDATVTVGVDDTGYDVKFFGATAGAYMLWDESADDLILGGAAGLSVNSTALVTGVLTTTAATVFNGGFASNADSTLGTDKKVQFRDAAIYINSSVDGQLDIVADTEIQIAATTIDINGAINASGEIIAASLDISGDIDVDGTTNLDVLDVDGAVNFAADVTFADGADLITASAGTSNLRLGVNAGNSITSGGNYNTVVGDDAGTAITTGDLMTAVGYRALFTEDTGERSTAVGAYALTAQNSAVENYNTAVGYAAGTAVTTGIQNTLIGGLAGDALTDADNNVAMGASALTSDTLGSKTTAIGTGTLATQNFTTATDSYNTAVGYFAGLAVTTGVQNTLIGALAGDAITDANNNTALGYAALSTNQRGAFNVAVGVGALQIANPSGAANTYNTAVGFDAGNAVTTGWQNTIVGGLAGDAMTTGDVNTFIGYQAAGDGIVTGARNVAVGGNSGLNLTSGGDNTLIGNNAGDALTTGNDNVIIGYLAGAHDINLTTGARNVLVGAYVDAATTGQTDSIVIGYNVIGAGDDIRAQHGVATWAAVSDERYKKDIVDSTVGLSFINDLTPRTFKYKTLGELPETFRAYKEGSTQVFKNSDTNHGFIAQEIKAAIDLHPEIKDGFKLWDERDDGGQEVAEAALIPVLVKAIQELSAKNDALEARITTLEG